MEVPAGQAIDSRNFLGAFTGKDEKGAEMILEQAKVVAVRKGLLDKYFEGWGGHDVSTT